MYKRASTENNLRSRLLKVARYINLYGISRTFIKIRGQAHMAEVESFEGKIWNNPFPTDRECERKNIAIIGCGNFAFTNIAYFLRKRERSFLRCTYDPLKSRALSLCKYFNGISAYADWTDILRDPRVKIVYIASNHSTHAEYAIACIAAGKNVFIEKPHVVTDDQLDRLLDTMKSYPSAKVFLGFNRPKSKLLKLLSERRARQPGPAMISWFVVGHPIADGHWYHDPSEGGRILGNLCHWTDATLRLLDLDSAFPCEVISVSPPETNAQYIVSFVFADGSCASITFSALGETFEGVRESLHIQVGDLIASIVDFKVLTIDLGERKERISLRHRDHGHEANILAPFDSEDENYDYEKERRHIEASARLFLGAKQSVVNNTPVNVRCSWNRPKES